MQGVECFLQDMHQQQTLDISCLKQYRAQAMYSRPKGFLFYEVGNQNIGSFLFLMNTSQEVRAVGFFKLKFQKYVFTGQKKLVNKKILVSRPLKTRKNPYFISTVCK
jgi:hypothetical protein